MKFVDSCLVCHRFLWNPTQICQECLSDFRASDILYQDVRGLSVFSLLHYVFPLESFAKLWKTPQGAELCQCLALELAQKFALECFSPVIGVIPMPAKIKGSRDHAYLIAEVLATYFKVPIATQFLERIQPREEQKSKTRYERESSNIRLTEDFKSWGEQGSNAGVWLLVDDVVTSGNTMSNAWNILGKPKALGLTLAATPLWALYREDFTKTALKEAFIGHPH